MWKRGGLFPLNEMSGLNRLFGAVGEVVVLLLMLLVDGCGYEYGLGPEGVGYAVERFLSLPFDVV